RLLETVRYYATLRLVATGELTATGARHRDHFLRFAEEAEPHLEAGGQEEWFRRVGLEYPHVRLALAWSRDNAEAGPLARMASALHLLWETAGPATEGEEWLDAPLAHDDLDPVLRAKTLFGRSYLAVVNFDLAT